MALKRSRLAARRRALGFTQESLAERLGVHPTTVRRWESGGIGNGPQPWVRRKLAEHLQVSAEELEELLSDRHGVLPWHSADEEDEVNRRALLKLLGGAALVAPFGGHLEHLRRGLDGALGAPTSAADIEEWEYTASRYASEVGYLPYVQVLPALIADLAEVQARLVRAPEALRPRMAHVCGQLSALMAIALFDNGDPEGARRYWRTAVRAADESGDATLRSHVRAKRAVYALYEPPSALPALMLSEEAIAAGKGGSHAGVASGHAIRAQALALLGRHDEARSALGDLDEVFARLPDSTVADCTSEWGWSEQRLRHVQSWVHSHAGRLDEAVAAQDAALALYPASAFRGPAQVQLHRAMCVVAAGDPSEGARYTVRTLQALPQHCRDNTVIHRTAVLVLGAIPERARTLPAVAEARELLALPPGPS
ncbi:MAG: helix-turn-helix domain protein [Actinobacteria bacterium]|nr:helix-turn-helix domain protein [Actinomycetota bacterium]